MSRGLMCIIGKYVAMLPRCHGYVHVIEELEGMSACDAGGGLLYCAHANRFLPCMTPAF